MDRITPDRVTGRRYGAGDAGAREPVSAPPPRPAADIYAAMGSTRIPGFTVSYDAAVVVEMPGGKIPELPDHEFALCS